MCLSAAIRIALISTVLGSMGLRSAGATTPTAAATLSPSATPGPSASPTSTATATATATATSTAATPTGTPWATGYMKISVSKVDPKVGETITVTVSGNTGLGSFGLYVVGDPIFSESPAPSPYAGTSWSWTLTAAQPGTARLRASVYGETMNGCNSCFIWATVSAAGSAVTVKSAATPTPTPAPQAFVSNSVWRVYHDSTGDLVVRADTTNAYAPSWSIKVIDVATGLEQDPANPLVTLKSQGPSAPPDSSGIQWWRFNRVRSGNVRFQTSVYAEYPCGTGCYMFTTVSAMSWDQTVSVP